MSLVLKLCLNKNLSKFLRRKVSQRHWIATYDYTIVQIRYQSNKRDLLPRDERHKTFADLTVAEKVKQGTKISFAALCVILGITGTIGIFLILYRELFGAKSPTSVYSMASSIVQYSDDVKALLGEPLGVYGKDTFHRRARQTPYFEQYYEGKDRIMAVRFHVGGPRGNASVFATARFDEPTKKYVLQTIRVMPDFDRNRYLTVYEKYE